MRSRTSYFNATLLKKSLTRFWPVWAAYLAIWILILPLEIGADLRWASDFEAAADVIKNLHRTVFVTAGEANQIMSFIFGAVSAMAVFSYLYNAKSAGMMASLPIRREGMFFVQTLAGLLPLLVSNVIVFLITAAVEAYYGITDFAALAQWLGAVSLANVAYYGFSVLCAQLTGHLAVLPCVYFVLNFTVVAVESIIRYLLSCFVFGMSTGGNTLDFLSPAFFMISNTGREAVTAVGVSGYHETVDYAFKGWGCLAVYAAFGLVCIGAALALYRRRRMETASDVVAVKPLRPVFKYCLAFGCALVLGALCCSIISSSIVASEGLLWLLPTMLIGGFIGYFAAEMLMRKTLRVWRGRWKGFLVVSAIIAVLLFACDLDILGYETYIPDSDDISYATVNGSGATFTTIDDGEGIDALITAHRSIIDCKPELENGITDSAYIYITYALRSGRTVDRQYRLDLEPESPDSRYIDLLEAALNTRGAIASRKRFTVPVSVSAISDPSVSFLSTDPAVAAGGSTELVLTPAEMYELYTTCILPDMNDCTIGLVWIDADDDYLDTAYNCTIRFSLGIPDSHNIPITAVPDSFPTAETYYESGRSYQSFYTVPTTRSHRTNAWLTAHGVELQTERESRAFRQAYDAALTAASAAGSSDVMSFFPAEYEYQPDYNGTYIK